MLGFYALLVFLIGLALLWRANKSRKASGLPEGRLVYSDTSRWLKQDEPLYDPEIGLTGKPDYLIQDGMEIIPVEVKTSHKPHAPSETHIYQLAAYCLLVERVFGVRPTYGMLHYTSPSQNSQTYKIDYTSQMEQEVIGMLAEIRHQAELKEVGRSHQSIARCTGCGYRDLCDQKLE